MSLKRSAKCSSTITLVQKLHDEKPRTVKRRFPPDKVVSVFFFAFSCAELVDGFSFLHAFCFFSCFCFACTGGSALTPGIRVFHSQ